VNKAFFDHWNSSLNCPSSTSNYANVRRASHVGNNWPRGCDVDNLKSYPCLHSRSVCLVLQVAKRYVVVHSRSIVWVVTHSKRALDGNSFRVLSPKFFYLTDIHLQEKHPKLHRLCFLQRLIRISEEGRLPWEVRGLFLWFWRDICVSLAGHFSLIFQGLRWTIWNGRWLFATLKKRRA